jgi:hypothetical protein
MVANELDYCPLAATNASHVGEFRYMAQGMIAEITVR